MDVLLHYQKLTEVNVLIVFKGIFLLQNLRNNYYTGWGKRGTTGLGGEQHDQPIM